MIHNKIGLIGFSLGNKRYKNTRKKEACIGSQIIGSGRIFLVWLQLLFPVEEMWPGVAGSLIFMTEKRVEWTECAAAADRIRVRLTATTGDQFGWKLVSGASTVTEPQLESEGSPLSSIFGGCPSFLRTPIPLSTRQLVKDWYESKNAHVSMEVMRGSNQKMCPL